MTGFNHALAGAAIGMAVQNPLLVIPIAFVSHFVLDVIPHFGGHPIYEWGHKHFPKLLLFDGFLCLTGTALVLWLAPQLALPVLLGIVFAMLPDLTLIHYYTKNKPQHWFHDFHLGIQWYERPPGIFVEASFLVFIGTTIAALLSFK